MMKYFFQILFIIISVNSFSQITDKCKPTTSIGAKLCGHATSIDNLCPECFDCRIRLIPLDSNYKILSFKLTLDKGSESSLFETFVQGCFFDDIKTKRIISNIQKGSILFLECIKARHINGKEEILKELVLTF